MRGDILTQVAQFQPAGPCCCQLGPRQSAVAFHHAEQIVEALLPSFIHLTISKTPGKDMWIGCQSREMSGLQGQK